MRALYPRIVLSLGLVAFYSPAWAQDSRNATPPANLSEAALKLAPYEARLAEAIQEYQRGNRHTALSTLSELATDPNIDGTQLQLQAKVYLGELYFVRGEDQLARQIFEQVIRSDPRYVLDPFRHPPDVAAFFNQVKLTMDLSDLEPPAPMPLRPPASAWTPLAVYHFQQDRRSRAWLYAGTQIATGTASIVLASILVGQHNSELGGISYPEGDETALRKIEGLQTANLICFLGFYGSWGASVVDAHRNWQGRRIEAAQGSSMQPALQVSLNGSW